MSKKFNYTFVILQILLLYGFLGCEFVSLFILHEFTKIQKDSGTKINLGSLKTQGRPC